MTLLLDQGTKPRNLGVKTASIGNLINVVLLGDYEISFKDFLAAAEYVLTNTSLEPNDIRHGFVQFVKGLKEVDGYNPGEKRLASAKPATS